MKYKLWKNGRGFDNCKEYRIIENEDNNAAHNSCRWQLLAEANCMQELKSLFDLSNSQRCSDIGDYGIPFIMFDDFYMQNGCCIKNVVYIGRKF